MSREWERIDFVCKNIPTFGQDMLTGKDLHGNLLRRKRIKWECRSQSTTPRQGDEADKASVIHFKDAILPASEEEEDNLTGIQEKLKVIFWGIQLSLFDSLA